MDFKNKKIAIIGLGVEGVSTARFLHKKGAEVWILDKRQREEFEQDFISAIEALGGQFILGSKYLDNLNQFEIIVRSPGVKGVTPELVQAAKEGVVITSQTKLFFELCPCSIIGVTGTKGKGTTSSLIYEMLKVDGQDAYLGGNIGVPPFDFLDKLTGQSVVVLELSSFQLQDLDKSPQIAVMLMTTSEHLDYHATTEEYIEAKRNILRFQTKDDFAVINRDYPASNESDIVTEGKVYRISRERETEDGCFVTGEKVIIRKNGNDQEIINTSEILLPGKHNLENICAAVMAADLAGVNQETMVKVLRNFKGLEHRLELVGEVAGVKYYDDSFSTVPETAIAAIEAFAAPEILILGGSSKNSDFTQLGIVIREAKNIRAIIGIGEEWETIKSQIANHQSQILMVEGATTMSQIVQAAAKLAKPGDVVLLSPACASFDMFKNYKERGQQFKAEVRKLGLA
ncbi:MAG TPA: UDP-N-acetylmuramoyl-L-alanine--D-glutamate ligase [Patescibacteria group bacterium]